MRTWADVAELVTTKTLNGGLVARCAPGLPFLLREGMEVAFVPPVLDVPRRAQVTSVQMQGADAAVVSFSGIEDIDVASALVGCHCLVRRADVPRDALVAADGGCAWAGFAVIDVQAGLIGEVAGVRTLPAQRLLEVSRVGATPVLIPFVDEFVQQIDEGARRIDVSVPAGLLDL